MQQWVLRNTVAVEPTIDMLVRVGYLRDGVVHTRAMLEEAVTRLILDAVQQNIYFVSHRHR